MDDTQPHRGGPSVHEETQPVGRRRPGRPRRRPLLAAALVLASLAVIYLLAPLRTNVLLIGIDRVEAGSWAGRTDTLILTTIVPLQPYVGLLSIPRDLWVELPGGEPNRINTANYFAELEAPGSGLRAAKAVVRHNFGVDVDYGVRLRFEGLVAAVDAVGGLPVVLDRPMAGYPAGPQLLSGDQALAFVRDRAGSDDFFRMERGQLVLRAFMRRLAEPRTWPRAPVLLKAVIGAVETDLPAWQWPRLLLAVARAGPDALDARVLDRSMTQGITTAGGAQVLQPRWESINPILLEMFGQ